MEIKNIAALVTGGASGMGKAVGKRLSAAGAKVTLLDLDEAAAKKTAHQTGALAIACDVTDEKSVIAAIQQAAQQHGPARICINCAGIVQAARMAGKEGPMPLAAFEKIIRINLTGTFNVMRLAAFAMTKAKTHGIIINTASIAAFEGQTGQTAYSASKGGIVSMTLPATRELSQFGIRVVTIAPGLVDTPLFDKLPEAAKTQLTSAVPFPKRLASPDEFAKLAIHIIENEMINGCVIRLDGALRMQ